MFKNKNILITGGTGSFGQKFAETILKKYKPNKLIIYSRDEYKQSEMQNKFIKYSKNLRFFIGDVRDMERLDFAMRNVDLVIHAAALKQVPAAEYNPQEFIKTNVIGTQNIVNACLESNVQKAILLSTKCSSNIWLFTLCKAEI